MPEYNRRLRWFLLGAVAVMSVLMLVLLGINWKLRADLNHSHARITRLEAQHLAEDASRRTTEVATCFATARNRPALAVILRLIAATATEQEDRRLVNGAISVYMDRTPTVPECEELARANNLDPADFPPTVRGESGNRP